MLLRRGLEPHAAAALEQELVGAGVGDEAAAGGDHGARLLGEHALERAAFEAAKGVLAVHGEYLGERGARFLLHFAVELHERQAHGRRQFGAERRFSGTAQADERDRLLHRVVLAHQSLDGDAHGARHFAQQQHRNVSLPGFELRQIALRDAGRDREALAAHAVLGAPGAHALAEPREIGVFLLLQRERSGHEL